MGAVTELVYLVEATVAKAEQERVLIRSLVPA